MIRIVRGPEPSGLLTIRQSELERVRKITTPSSDDIGKKYRDFAGSLRAAQKYKCCYCEVHVSQSFNDVEHYRPKARADRKPGSAATHGYWWLAWSWENLLFACPACNRSGKNDRFPLAQGSVALVAEEDPPGREIPLLIDPVAENGIDSIQFRPGIEDENQWMPSPREENERGKTTIEVLELDRDDLLDFYREHVAGRLMPIVKDLRQALETDDGEMISYEWQKAIRELRPHNEMIGLAYDVFDHYFPKEIRRRWSLQLSVPGLEE